MKRRVQVANLKELYDYRTHCPFCSSQLRWICSTGMVGRKNYNPGYSEISFSEGTNHYKLTYDGSSTFCTQINAYIEQILIHKITNDIIYREQEESMWSSTLINSALKYNQVSLQRSCECVYEYHLTTEVIDLSSVHNTSFTPAIFSESFFVDEQETNLYTKITQMYGAHKTKISCFNLSNNPQNAGLACTFEKDIPLVTFDWKDVDSIISKVRFLLTYS